MINPTREQIERAERINAATMRLLSLDILDFDRHDHIAQARELLHQHDRGMALAFEVVGDDTNVLDENLLSTVVQHSISAHLRIAEAMRPTKTEGTF
jgi:hypothetical protein